MGRFRTPGPALYRNRPFCLYCQFLSVHDKYNGMVINDLRGSGCQQIPPDRSRLVIRPDFITDQDIFVIDNPGTSFQATDFRLV